VSQFRRLRDSALCADKNTQRKMRSRSGWRFPGDQRCTCRKLPCLSTHHRGSSAQGWRDPVRNENAKAGERTSLCRYGTVETLAQIGIGVNWDFPGILPFSQRITWQAKPLSTLGDWMYGVALRMHHPRAVDPALRSTRRTFLGEIDRRAATRAILRSSRSHTLGMTISANSSLTC
jgi:hypothetical protein